MNYNVVVFVNYIDADFVDEENYDYKSRLDEASLFILDWFDQVIINKKLNIKALELDNVEVGGPGVGDAYVGGGYQAVDVPNPSKVYFNVFTSKKSEVDKLVNFANKNLKNAFEKKFDELSLCDDDYYGGYAVTIW